MLDRVDQGVHGVVDFIMVLVVKAKMLVINAVLQIFLYENIQKWLIER